MDRLGDYKPTPTEERLIEVLLNPTHARKSVAAICKLAKCSTQSYYNAVKKPDFNNLVRDIAITALKGRVGSVIESTFKYSHTAKGHQDRKLALELAGAYTQTTKTEIAGTLDMPAEDKEDLIAKVARRMQEQQDKSEA